MIEALKRTETDKKIGIVELCSGYTPDGKEFHAYISIIPSKYDQYIKNCKKGIPIDLRNYGEILHYGSGAQPPEDIRRKMQKRYNANTPLEKTIRAQLRKLQQEEE